MRRLNMKQKYKKSLVIVSLAVVTTIVIFGINSWDQKIERSGAAATEFLANEGIKVRTVDTTRFAEQKTAEVEKPETKDQTTEAEPSSNKTDDSANEPNSHTANTDSTAAESGNETPPPSAEDSTISITEIKEKYVLQFLELEKEISSRFAVILNEALQDYQTKKANNEEINLIDFQSKYATKIVNLEKESDKRFAEIYLKFEAELVENNYPKSEASPYQAKYLAEKQNRERDALEKFKEMK